MELPQFTRVATYYIFLVLNNQTDRITTSYIEYICLRIFIAHGTPILREVLQRSVNEVIKYLTTVPTYRHSHLVENPWT